MTERPLFTVEPGESDTATKRDKERNVDKSIKIAKSKTFSNHPIVPWRHADRSSGKSQPSGLPPDLFHWYPKGELNLSGKRLDPSALFSLIRSYGHDLKKLDLSGCDLSYVDWRCLECLSGVEELNLSNNPLHHLDLKFLKHMRHSLKKLDLSGCNLRYVDWRCLKRVSGLKELNLSNNPLDHFDLEVWEHVPHSLKKLDLSGCALTSQHLEDLTYLGRLKDLNLSNNPLHSIKLHCFKSVPGLRSLDISGCGLTDKDLKDFALWDGVEELNLSNNPLSHMLQYPKNLRKLNLSGCCLTKWPSGLGECSSLEQLDLSNNFFGHQLENVPPSVSELSNLNRIIFEDAVYTKLMFWNELKQGIWDVAGNIFCAFLILYFLTGMCGFIFI